MDPPSKYGLFAALAPPSIPLPDHPSSTDHLSDPQLEPSAAAAPSAVDRLSTLPDDVLGKIFFHLRRLQTPLDVVEESGQALRQTCKTIHSSAACLEQVSSSFKNLCAFHGPM